MEKIYLKQNILHDLIHKKIIINNKFYFIFTRIYCTFNNIIITFFKLYYFELKYILLDIYYSKLIYLC